MNKLFLSIIFLFLISFFPVKAQLTNSIITGQISGTVCKGATILVPFASTGTFETGNVFKVQISTSTSSPRTWTDLVTEGSSSPLKTVIPVNYEENGNFTTLYYIRVVALKPSINGQEIIIPNIHITILCNYLSGNRAEMI